MPPSTVKPARMEAGRVIDSESVAARVVDEPRMIAAAGPFALTMVRTLPRASMAE